MDRIGFLLAIAGLLVGGYALISVGDKQTEIDVLRTANRDLEDRLYTLEAEVAQATGKEPPAKLRAAPDGTIPLGHASDGTPVGLQGRPATAAARIAALEKRVAEQDAALEKIEAETAEQAEATQRTRWSPDRFYGNLDMAAKSLGLDETQKSDMQDVLDRAKRELDDLYAIPNDAGETWAEIRKPKMVTGEGFSIAMPDMAKITKFKQGRIPGSSETFGEAEKRIREDAFARMRRNLTPDQTTKWDKAHKDGLLRGGSGVQAVSFIGVNTTKDK